jgi:glutaminyl-peptide cyclotransferase
MTKTSQKKGVSSPAARPVAGSGPARRSVSRTRQYVLFSVFVLILLGVPTAYYLHFMPEEVINISFKVVERYSHSEDAFTQGLYFEDGILYESTGNPSQNVRLGKPKESWVRKIRLRPAPVEIDRFELPEKYFGEGLTVFNDRIYQLTWQNRVIFVYDRDLGPPKEFEYRSEGWGITHDNQHLIISNGSSVLSFVDPTTLKEDHFITVKQGNRSINDLNELEYVDGKIYANIYQQDRVIEIDPKTGNVTGEIDFSELWPYKNRPANLGAVLNGIAYDRESGHFLITGKYWPTIFEIKLRR